MKCKNNVSKVCILTEFEMIRKRRKIENNVSIECILTIFEMIWNCRETFVMAHKPPGKKINTKKCFY